MSDCYDKRKQEEYRECQHFFSFVNVVLRERHCFPLLFSVSLIFPLVRCSYAVAFFSSLSSTTVRSNVSVKAFAAIYGYAGTFPALDSSPPSIVLCSMNADVLANLLRDNEKLCRSVSSRTAYVEYELDHLRALRAELALSSTQTRKRGGTTKQPLPAALNVEHESPKKWYSPAFATALKAEVQKLKCRGGDTRLHKGDWETVAASLRSAGHQTCTPYELLTLLKRLQPAAPQFTTAEVKALSQLVQEKGYNWALVCKVLRQRFGHERQPFDVARQYRFCTRRAFVQNHLTSSQLTELLDSDAVSAQHPDYDELSVKASRFTDHRALQVNPRYLQKELERLAFARFVPARYHLYWKLANLMCPLPLRWPCHLDEFYYCLSLCYSQLSLGELARVHECTVEEVRDRVVRFLLSLSRSPDTLRFEECSKKLVGNVSAARVICQIAEELHERGV